jgi:hypothetical protein
MQASSPHKEKPVDNPKIPLDIASYKLYYVNYEIGLEFLPQPLCPKPIDNLRPFPQAHPPVGAVALDTNVVRNQRNYLSDLFVDLPCASSY